LAPPRLPTKVKKLALDKPKVHHLPAWGGLDDPKRMEIIRRIAMQRGRDPRIATQAVKILKQYKVQPRQYKRQAAAILKWVQDPKNVYYVNEPGERLQDPLYTLKVGYGDCDDMVILLLALYESIRLPTKLVISGLNKSTGQKVRHIEGQHYPKNVKWTHIYGMVGDHPFKTKKWYFFEPTMPMPLGWDVISGDSSMIPEMNAYSGAYGNPYGQGMASSMIGASIGGAMAEGEAGDKGKLLDWHRIVPAVVIGAATSLLTSLLLDWMRGTGTFQGRGTITERIDNVKADDPVPMSYKAKA